MALHRDIYWVGKQWAVTGNGVQACDQKQKSQFDIEIDRLWDDDVLDGLLGHKWLDLDDLLKALSVARQRFPAPPVASPAPATTVADPGPPKFDMVFSGRARFIRPWRVRMRK